jgi:hypothetical protein
MPDEQVEPRTINYRQWFPWIEVFRAFGVALDPKKLLLAAAGILVMAIWWWLCSLVFYAPRQQPPEFPKNYPAADYKGDDEKTRQENAWKQFKEDRNKWNLLHEAAGRTPVDTDAGDLAASLDEFNRIEPVYRKEVVEQGKRRFTVKEGTNEVAYEITTKPYGQISTWPWFEDRGPNPYLLVTGHKEYRDELGRVHHVPWEKGQFPSWFATNQVPVLLEPLIKFLRPIYYMLQSPVGFWNYVYFSLLLLGNLAIWAVFGGAITRMAAVQVARKEKIGITEALRFTKARLISFFSAPLFPVLFVMFVVLLTIIFGFFHLIPVIGDILVDGVFWFLIVLAGLVMAVILVGLVGWPMMYATISTEGSDSFDALSRSYSYVYQSPWNYIWYSAVALVYGMIVIFFVGFMGSLTVYLGKWGVSQTPFTTITDRKPEYLFVYAPTSFEWRELLTGGNMTDAGFTWANKVGAFLVAAWLYLIFLIVLGFGYSFFWCASTIIYLLMRRKVDDTELDEVYLEEEEAEGAYTPPPEPEAPAAEHGHELQMVEAPTLKTPEPPAPDVPGPAAGTTAPVQKSDGNPPDAGRTP